MDRRTGSPPGTGDRAPARGYAAGHPVTLLPAVAVALVVLLVVASARTGAAGPSGPKLTPLVWSGGRNASNGILGMGLSEFGANVSVGPAGGAPGAALEVGYEGLEEIGSSGNPIASARLPNASSGALPGWISSNESTSTSFAFQLDQIFQAARPTGVVRGNATVVLTIASGATSATAANLTIDLAIEGWPWVHDTDALVLNLSVRPVAPPVGLLAGVGPDEVGCGPSGAASETLAWPASVLAIDSSGDHLSVADESVLEGNGSGGLLQIAIPGGDGGYAQVDVVLSISVPMAPSSAPPLPLTLVALCAAWAGVVGAVAWVALRRLSEPPTPPPGPAAPPSP